MKLHWFTHSAAALSIQAILWLVSGSVFVGAAAGAFFYIGREVAQYESKGYWDHAGWISPMLAVLAVAAASVLRP